MVEKGEKMQIEKRMQKLLNEITDSIQVEADIVNLDGIIVASSDTTRIGKQDSYIKSRRAAETNNNFAYNGRTYTKFNANLNRAYYLSMMGTSEVIRNYCILIISLIELHLKFTSQRMDKEDIICAAMLGQISDLEFQEAVRKYNIDTATPRCVFVIRTEGMEATEVHKVMINVFPKDMEDFLVLMDSQTVGLVKTVIDEMDESDLIQLGAAIEDTILSETSIKSYIGIGQVKSSIYGIRESYKEAIKAMDVGRTFEPNNRVFYYDTLLLERFLSEVPVNISEKYYKHIFHGEVNKVLNDEMIATIEKFFENNLNLSETSRQLYIHRNTLVYRLDKIQKTLGLDLRNFHDAVTFKIMMMLERQNRECSG